MRGVERGDDERHAGEGALREKAASLIYDHEAAVADEPERIDGGRVHRKSAEPFDGVDEQAGEMHRIGRNCADERGHQNC